MPKIPRTADVNEIVRLTELEYVREALFSGKTDMEIAIAIDIGMDYLNQLKKEVIDQTNQTYTDRLKFMRALTMKRLETLYQLVHVQAQGVPRVTVNKKGEKQELPGDPDKQWAKLELEVIKAQQDLMDNDIRLQQEKEAAAIKPNYTNIQQITIIHDSELYQAAQEGAWQEMLTVEPESVHQMLLAESIAGDDADGADS